jgi:NAD(P)-dependent dehydrogenase (short-subunit alcohol dehydrogenase family)
MAASSLGRLGEPEDVARLVSFLASKDSDFMTGNFSYFVVMIRSDLGKQDNLLPSTVVYGLID